MCARDSGVIQEGDGYIGVVVKVWTKIRVGDILLIEEKRLKQKQCWEYQTAIWSDYAVDSEGEQSSSHYSKFPALLRVH